MSSTSPPPPTATPSSAALNNARQQHKRKYLASLVSSSSLLGGVEAFDKSRDTTKCEQPTTLVSGGSTAAAGGVKPFSVSLSYTLPKKSPRSTLQSTTPAPSRVGGEGSELPTAETSRGEVLPPVPPQRSRNTSRSKTSNQSAELHQTVMRKEAIHLKEEEYDGSEQSFVALLMSRLRQQCSMLVVSDTTTTTSQATAAGLTEQQQGTSSVEEQRNLWAAVEARNRRSLLKSLPPELVLLTLDYSSVVDLCRLACVNRRMNVIASSPVVWMQICKRFRLTYERTSGLTFVKQPKEIVRDYLVQARRVLDQRVNEEERALEQLEQRLNQRVEQAASFSSEFHQEARAQHPNLVRLIEHAERQLRETAQQTETMEATRVELLRLAQTNRDLLAKSQRELRSILTTIEPNAIRQQQQQSTAVSSNAFSAALQRPSTLQHNNASGIVASDGNKTATTTLIVLDTDAIERFERRVNRVILQRFDELPLVIRRGTTTFSAMELLVLQLGDNSNLGTFIKQRWNQWKSFFALNKGYYDLCDAIADGERIPAASASCASLMRKILSMNDNELDQCAFPAEL